MGQQMTMKEVIVAVASVSAETPVKFDTGKYFAWPHSYRGYYDQLAISGRKKELVNADEALVRLGAILGEEIGESAEIMTDDTPVWHSAYGEVEHLAVIGYKINKKGELVFKTEYIDW